MTKSRPKRFIKNCLFRAFHVVQRLPREDGMLLTFDDGPHPAVTPVVLDLLAQYGAKAIFFVVGDRIPRAPHLLSRILAEGHKIGNHTYRHPLDGNPALPDYYRDVQECQAVLESHTGTRPSLFRPPLGSLTLGSLLAPRLAGLRTMLWSVDVDDWKLRNQTAAVETGHRLAMSANQGDIVLLHDDNPCVVAVLETALPQLYQRKIELSKALSRVCD